MIYNHLIVNNEEKETLYLYIDFNYEFSIDFSLKSKKEKIQTLYEQVLKYLKEKKIDFKAGKIFLVVGGLVIGSLFIHNATYSMLKDESPKTYQYQEQITLFDDTSNTNDIFYKVETETENSKEQISEQSDTYQEQTNTTNTDPIISVTIPPVVVPPRNPIASSPETPVTPYVQQPPAAPVISEKLVTLYRSGGALETLNLEDYVIGVVAAEMPASFNVEALKAQSVLSRTYALKKISRDQVLTDTTSNQVYKDNSQLKALWGSSFQIYFDKIKNAVAATKGEYLSYNDDYIEAVYHSTSNGQTEDALTVWGNDYPYLKSVDSHWDLDASSFLRDTQKEFNILSSIIGLDFNATTNVQVLSRTGSNRVNEILIGNKTFSGIELRSLLGLRSTDFDITINGSNVTFVTRGYGHGVGMSQYGANGMARDGYLYKDILNHYYPGTQIKN